MNRRDVIKAAVATVVTGFAGAAAAPVLASRGAPQVLGVDFASKPDETVDMVRDLMDGRLYVWSPKALKWLQMREAHPVQGMTLRWEPRP